MMTSTSISSYLVIIVMLYHVSCSFPVFENPYPMDVHESPVTCTAYFAECPPDIIPILYSIGAKHKKTGYSQKVGYGKYDGPDGGMMVI